MMGELGVDGSNGGAGLHPGSGLGWKCSAPPDPTSLREDCLSAAESAAQQLLSCIHPTLDSEEERRDIIDYVARLIKSHHNCEVFPFGSVPLKTYLPDGDIDLTVINANDSLALDVLALLQMEEKNVTAEFQVKDTQYIDAEVKLVKCIVRNTVIDISFNQLGGLSALCFLEQVDRLVGRNHLFKRSIILIKTWCYYESRILGAHHGLISTYALETLVLYIFQLFHSSLRGPLGVLYRFLEYYGKFDWENYCISLKGPVCKSSLPDIVVKVPENGWTDLMFSEEFLENCTEMFSVSSRVPDRRPKAFQPKFLNIIDPLKENNNLGRSVHVGNFYRIQSAFKYGARKLGQILSPPFDKIADDIHNFFSNAVATSSHGNDILNRIPRMALAFGDGESLASSMSSPVTFIFEGGMLPNLSVNANDGVELEPKNHQMEIPLNTGSEGWYATGVSSGNRIAAETYDVVASSSSPYYALHSNYGTPLSWSNCHQPMYDFRSWPEESKEQWDDYNRHQQCMDNSLGIYTANPASCPSKAHYGDGISIDYRDMGFASLGDLEAFNPLADLTGDYDSHIRSLLYGQLCNGFSLSQVAHHLTPFWWVPIPSTMRSVSGDQSNCRASHSAPPAYGSSSDAAQKNCFLGERHLQGSSSEQVSDTRDQFNSSYAAAAGGGLKNKENGTPETLPGKSGSQQQRSSNAESPSPSVRHGNQRDGSSSNTSKTWRIEFGSIGNLAEEVISASADNTRGSTTLIASRDKQGRSRTAAGMKQERYVAGQGIHLKNEAEFPPLGL